MISQFQYCTNQGIGWHSLAIREYVRYCTISAAAVHRKKTNAQLFFFQFTWDAYYPNRATLLIRDYRGPNYSLDCTAMFTSYLHEFSHLHLHRTLMLDIRVEQHNKDKRTVFLCILWMMIIREKEFVHIVEDRLVYTTDVFDSTNINTVYDSATRSNAQISHTTMRLTSSVHTNTNAPLRRKMEDRAVRPGGPGLIFTQQSSKWPCINF